MQTTATPLSAVYISRPLNSHSFTVCHTVSLPFSRCHGRFYISHGLTNFEWIFFPNLQLSKKTNTGSTFQCCWRTHSSMININKTSSRSSLSLNWALLFIMLVTTDMDNPLHWKLLQDLLKTAKQIHSCI